MKNSLLPTCSNESMAKELRALIRMAAHVETLLLDLDLDDASPQFCLQTFRSLLAKEIETLEHATTKPKHLKLASGSNNIN